MEDNNKMPWWETAIQFMAMLFFIPLFYILLACFGIGMGIYDMIWYAEAPEGCCRNGCTRCPWGDKRYKKYRKEYQNSKTRPRVRS